MKDPNTKIQVAKKYAKNLQYSSRTYPANIHIIITIAIKEHPANIFPITHPTRVSLDLRVISMYTFSLRINSCWSIN